MIAAWMLYSIVVAGFFAVAAWALDHALRPYGLPLRWIWSGALVAGAFGPLIPLVRRFAVLGGAPPPPSAVPVELSSILADAATVSVGAESFLRALDPILVGLWICASVLLLAFAARSLVDLRRWVRSSVPEVRDGIEILVSDRLGPAAVGLFRGRVVIPRWLASEPGTGLDLAIRHEREHVRAGDTVFGPAAFLLLAVVPWNLPLWWSFRRLREAIEIDCDRRVLEDSAVRPAILRDYAEVLLAVGARGRGGLRPVPLLEAGSFLERRIRAWTGARPRRPVLRGSLLGLVAALALVAACTSPSPEEAGGDPTSPGEGSGADPVVREVPDSSSVAPDGRETSTEVDPEPASPAPVPETAGSVASETEGAPGSEPVPAPRPAGEPAFTPYTVAPDLRNRLEVQRALQDEYPPLLRDAGIGGTIGIWFYIDENGSVQDVRVDESSGHAALDGAAVRVASTMRFTPARDGDEQVPVWISLPITFQPPQ